jgi:hypothetical protein
MNRPDQAMSMVKDFCPVSGAEVEGYINCLESHIEAIRAALNGYPDSDLVSLAETTRIGCEQAGRLQEKVSLLRGALKAIRNSQETDAVTFSAWVAERVKEALEE